MITTLRSLIFILLLSASHASFAQNSSLTGTVSGDNNEPVAGAFVSIKSISRTVRTDTAGKFIFKDLAKGSYQMSFEKDEYFTQTRRVSVSEGQDNTVDIHLNTIVTQFKAIKIDKRTSDNVIGKLDLQLRPVSSSQDLLRLVPGLFIAQHAGGGKAEQIFMRGFDIDHGTDFAIYVDGMPVNMPSHAHGQGYADLHFLIPETVQKLEVNKGPHATKYGDLATAGSGEFKTLSSLDRNIVKLEYGMFDTRRALLMMNVMDNKHLFSSKKENIYVAGEYKFTNSYFIAKQNFYRTNLFTKYTGELNNGDRLNITLSTFQSQWDASGQIPDRKVEDGTITRYGSIDPTEGGKTGRSNFNIAHEHKLRNGTFKNQLFYSRYDFNLYSNFTFFLKDSVNGDQIYQADHRNILGWNSTLQYNNKLAGKDITTTFGTGVRYDNSSIRLDHTVKREFLNTIVNGKLNQVQTWFYIDEVYQATDKLKINIGTRADVYNFNFKNNTYDTASGNALKGIVSPKVNLTYVMNNRVELFAKSGFGFHSNDARAVIVGQLENTLARAFGNEIGSTFKPSKRMIANVALWALDLQSELVYVGDEGIVEATGRTRRIGIDLSVRYQIGRYLFIDADVNVNKGRLRDAPKGEDRIPLAPTFTSIGGISYKKTKGLNGSLRYRYMGNRAAIEDNSIVAQGYFLADAVLNYNVKNYQFGLIVENLFNTQWKEAQFATESKLREESSPVNEIHFTPGIPRFVKVSFAYLF
jgi:outer membrane receptor protein involved in Fe transport